MNQSNLREVEKRTYMSYHQDGLIDIFVGVYVLLFGLSIWLFTLGEFSMWFIIPAIFVAIMAPIWVSVKKKITMPRIGYVKFGIKGANKLLAIFIGLMVVGLGAFMVISFANTQAWVQALRDLIIPNSMIIIGVGAAAISVLFGYTMGLNRLYAYGLLTLLAFVIGYFIIIPFAYILLLLGFVIIVNGFVLMISFVRKYPLAKGGRAVVE